MSEEPSSIDPSGIPDEALGSDAAESTPSDPVAEARAQAKEILADAERRAAALKAEAVGLRYEADSKSTRAPIASADSTPGVIDLTAPTTAANDAMRRLDQLDNNVSKDHDGLLRLLEDASAPITAGRPAVASKQTEPDEGKVAPVSTSSASMVQAWIGRLPIPAPYQSAVLVVAVVVFVLIAAGAFLAGV